MKNKDHTFLIIGVFLTIVILIVIGLYALVGDVSTQDIICGITAIGLLNGLCFFAHKAFNVKKITVTVVEQ